MTDYKQSPFSASLLSSDPMQRKMREAEKELTKVKKQQQKTNKKQQKKSHVNTNEIKSKPLWWMLFMFICSLLYLFPEIVFNASLTDIAGGRNSSEEDLREIELFGRTISGIGVTLLLADLLLKGKHVANAVRAFSYLFFIGMLVWPTIFFGQKWLVDHFIIDASTPEQRQQAYFSQVLRSALIEKTIQFDGIEYDPDKAHSAIEKTFLAVFGGLVYADDKLVVELNNKKRMIMEKFVYDRAMSGFTEHYADYNELRKTLQNNYRDYAKGSNKYNQALNNAPTQSDKYWLETQQQVKRGWNQYQKGVTAYETKVESRAQSIAPKVYHYFEERQECKENKNKDRQNRCYKQLQTAYDKEIKKHKIPYIAPDEWLIREEISTAENIGQSVVAGILTFGLYTALQATDALIGGDAGFKDHRMVYTNDINHYKALLMVKMKGDFIKQSGGYPLSIRSIPDFRKHPLTSVKVTKKLRSKGLVLPAAWSISDRNSFDKAVAKKVKQQADLKWKTTMKKRGIAFPPNLSWQQFQRNTHIQAQIKRDMKASYVNPILADWNNLQFKQYVIMSNIKRKTTEYINVLEAQKAEFADGGTFETVGKSALRATIVPPISMSISLALVLLTILKLPMKAFELIQAKRQVNDENPQRIKHALSFSLISLIFIVPFLLGGNQYTLKDSAVNYFFEQMDKNDSAMISFALKWLLITQPLVQPIGASINETLLITPAFNAISGPLNDFDLNIMPEEITKKKVPSNNALLPLYITTNVKNASISIMNIKPKYRVGMPLPAGNYDIKVSAPGYNAVRQFIYLKAEKTKFNITL